MFIGRALASLIQACSMLRFPCLSGPLHCKPWHMQYNNAWNISNPKFNAVWGVNSMEDRIWGWECGRQKRRGQMRPGRKDWEDILTWQSVDPLCNVFFRVWVISRYILVNGYARYLIHAVNYVQHQLGVQLSPLSCGQLVVIMVWIDPYNS